MRPARNSGLPSASVEGPSTDAAAALHRLATLLAELASRRSPAWTPLRALGIACVIRSEEHTSELQSLMRISYAVFCLKKKTKNHSPQYHTDKQYIKYNTI